MNGFELNKIAAAILVAGIIAMFAGFGADIFYGKSNHHAVNNNEKRGYKIEGVTEAVVSTGGEFKFPEFEIGKLMAAANVDNGKNIFKKCSVCHSEDKGGPNKVGPDLWSIIGHDKGVKEGFAYSEAMKSKGGKWGYEELFHFLFAPQQYVKGTKMGFAGIKKPEEIADVVAYLRSKSDSPAPLPPADLVSK